MEINISELEAFKPLNIEVFTEIQAQALDHIYSILGERPQEQEYKMNFITWVRNLNILTVIVFMLYLLLLVFTLIHVFTWTSVEAVASFEKYGLNGAMDSLVTLDSNGIQVSQQIYVVVHQLSILGVTELGIVAFSMLHTYRGQFTLSSEPNYVVGQKVRNTFRGLGWFVNRYWPIVIAIACAGVVILANLSSGFNMFVSALIPTMTIALSEYFSHLFSKSYASTLERRQEYLTDLDEWMHFQAHPEDHKDFLSVLGGFIIEKYKRTKTGRLYEDWNDDLANALAAREITRNLNRKTGIEAAMELFLNPTTE